MENIDLVYAYRRAPDVGKSRAREDLVNALAAYTVSNGIANYPDTFLDFYQLREDKAFMAELDQRLAQERAMRPKSTLGTIAHHSPPGPEISNQRGKIWTPNH